MTTDTAPRHRADVVTSAVVAASALRAVRTLTDALWLDGDNWDRGSALALEGASVTVTGSREVTIHVPASRMARTVRMPRAYVYGQASTLASSIADLTDAPLATALNTDNGKGTVTLSW